MMKRFLPIFLLVVALLGTEKEAKAQAHLTINTLLNFPDTVNYGDAIFPIVILENTGNTPYIGSMQVMILGEDSLATPQFLFNSSQPDTLFPADTISLFQGGNGFAINNNTGFRMGNNVVVVWPHSVQSTVLIDTFYTNVFVKMPVGLPDKPSITGLTCYPNPAGNFIRLIAANYKLESVRIMDLTGRVLNTFPLEGDDNAQIPLDALPDGIYFIEVFTSDKASAVIKLVHLND